MRTGKFKRINMGFNYKLAEEIIDCFNSDDASNLIDLISSLQCEDTDDIIKSIFKEGKANILKPEKYTLLHYFCENYLYHYLMHERWFLLDEICDEFDADNIIDYIDHTAKILNEYGIPDSNYAMKIREFDKKYQASGYELNYEYKELIRKTYDNMIENFNDIDTNIVEATFFLLYDNKEFLFKFNKFLSRYIKTSYLPTDEFGNIKRCSYLPEWLKRAVFYRDRGRCQLW